MNLKDKKAMINMFKEESNHIFKEVHFKLNQTVGKLMKEALKKDDDDSKIYASFTAMAIEEIFPSIIKSYEIVGIDKKNAKEILNALDNLINEMNEKFDFP